METDMIINVGASTRPAGLYRAQPPQAALSAEDCSPAVKGTGRTNMDQPTRKQIRLTQYDYSLANAYFITICTEQRRNLFWENAGAGIACPEDVRLTQSGRIADAVIREIPTRYPAISVDRYVIMPNHIHLLLQIHTDSSGRPMVAPTVSTVVQQMKGKISKEIGRGIWQKGFYDHVIRGDKDYQEVWEYIEGNPSRWLEDKLYNK